jgi:hypothetical protein
MTPATSERRCLLCGLRGCTRTDPHLALHKSQREVFEDASRFRVLVTSRRWGKTTLQKAEVLRDMGKPGLVWYLAPTYDMCRDLMWAALRALVPRAWRWRRSGAVDLPARASNIQIGYEGEARGRC